MTSKQALKKAEARTGLPIGVSCCIMTETEMRIIEKDLDVLEIIKGKLMWVENHKLYIGLQNDTYTELTEEDFNYDDRYRILKEWLENDKDKTGYIVEGTQWGSWGNDK